MNPTLRGFIKKEFLQSLRDPRNWVLLFVAPAMQMLVFGIAISSDITNIRLSAPYHQDDYMLNDVYKHAIASKWFIPAKTKSLDPFEVINNNEADVVLVPPPGGLTRSFVKGTGEVQVLINAMNVNKAQAIENYLKNIITATVLENTGAPLAERPIVFDFRILYNPTMRSSVFLVPAVMGMILCLITIIFTSMSVTKEKEQGTLETLISAPVSSTEILLGKSIPFIILGICNIPITLSVAVFILKIPIKGPLILVLFSTMIFVCVTVATGILISTVCKTQQQSMMGSFLFLFPAQLLSGLMFPIENMPTYMKGFAYVNPLYYFNEVLRNIMLKGGDPIVITRNIAILILMAVILTVVSFSRFKTKLQ